MAPVRVTEVTPAPLDLSRFRGILTPSAWEAVARGMERARDVFGSRRVINVNSTARGGGVAELLQGMIAYVRGAGVEGHWLVIAGDTGFFTVTKRLHNRLHDAEGDGGSLGEREARIYAATLDANAGELRARVSPGDIVILHDPQTAGLVTPMREAGAMVLWRCHIGVDRVTPLVRSAWDFLRPHLRDAHRYVFSRRAFVWEDLDPSRIEIVPPSIDAFSPKNQDLDPSVVASILAAAGIAPGRSEVPPRYQRVEGRFAEVSARVELVDGSKPVPPGEPVVLQVSRWDRLKDPVGVLQGSADHLRSDAHLVLAGPAAEAVADDPEGAAVLQEVVAARRQLSPARRDRIHLLALPMDDIQDNAAIVNALQRRATVVVQKSLAEGFGLTVAEAMWKARPVVAGRVGGIQDQIEHGVTGILLDDPRDLAAFGAAVESLLQDPGRARRIGEAARERVRTDLLHTTHLLHYLRVLEGLIAAGD